MSRATDNHLQYTMLVIQNDSCLLMAKMDAEQDKLKDELTETQRSNMPPQP
jgi:hypothetical protein